MLDLLNSALHRRAALPELSSGSDALRLVDGEGDGLPGLFVDDFAGHWLVQTKGIPFPEEVRHSSSLGWRSLWWKRLEQQEKSAPELISGDSSPHVLMHEHGLSYQIDFSAGYSQGIFLDQRIQRKRLMDLCTSLARRDQTAHVLNLFAYTCAFSVAAAATGALTESIDLSRSYLEWGKRNFAANGIEASAHYFCRGDSFDWLRRLANKGRQYEIVILDPPTFSRNDSGQVWRAEKDYPALLAATLKVLAPQGRVLCSTNHRGLPYSVFLELLDRGAAEAGRPISEIESGGLPADFTGEPYLKAMWLRF